METRPGWTAYTGVPFGAEMSMPKWNARDCPEIRGSLKYARTGWTRSNGSRGHEYATSASSTMMAVPSGADEALRANVRLLGEILGKVLVEQEGRELFQLEEEIRNLSRAGRQGDAEAAAQLADRLASLALEPQAVVLRAFSLYFQLANIAEQHHRLRRRRA